MHVTADWTAEKTRSPDSKIQHKKKIQIQAQRERICKNKTEH